MRKEAAEQVVLFTESVKSLYAEIDSWLVSSKLHGTQEEMEITEEATGPYKAKKFTLLDQSGKKIAEMVPVGTYIIGGNGRIDFNGTIDKAILVNFEVGGPSMTTKISVGDQTDTTTTFFYKGIDKKGWYWIEDARRAKANYFTKDLFIELLREVSDYELT